MSTSQLLLISIQLSFFFHCSLGFLAHKLVLPFSIYLHPPFFIFYSEILFITSLSHCPPECFSKLLIAICTRGNAFSCTHFLQNLFLTDFPPRFHLFPHLVLVSIQFNRFSTDDAFWKCKTETVWTTWDPLSGTWLSASSRFSSWCTSLSGRVSKAPER